MILISNMITPVTVYPDFGLFNWIGKFSSNPLSWNRDHDVSVSSLKLFEYFMKDNQTSPKTAVR